jgi:drug/metabolite transporter (DMT)-like permease
MLGGMVLPFVVGILFYDEPLTTGKIICFAAIAVALCLTFQKSESHKKGYIYYIGIFIFNGMSGVLSKIFQESDYSKTSSAGYSVLSAAATVIVAGIMLLFMKKSLPKIDKASLGYIATGGVLNKIANYLLLIALVHVPASTQYPMVTGGVMIVSTLLGFCTSKKPGIREIISVTLSFAGIMALVVI